MKARFNNNTAEFNTSEATNSNNGITVTGGRNNMILDNGLYILQLTSNGQLLLTDNIIIQN